MKNLRFKDSIAINYIVTTALLIGVVFITFFSAVSVTISNHLNEDIILLTQQHIDIVQVKCNEILFKTHDEWIENEKNMVDVLPVFVEVIDMDGKLIEKSPNLKDRRLHFDRNVKKNIFYDSVLGDKQIRQSQTAIYCKGGRIAGYMLIAMSMEGIQDAMHSLKHTMIFSYPIILIMLFFIARFIAGRNIAPINYIIDESNRITHDSLNNRLSLPTNKDELYTLSETINNLLDRLVGAVEREKNFTSYASHELRTPLSVLKGTMEVLIRKPRTQNEYETKIKYCITRIDNLNSMVDQLLLLTRQENEKLLLDIQAYNINDLINDSIKSSSTLIISKNIDISINSNHHVIYTDAHIFSTVFNNLLNNAIKFIPENRRIEINVREENAILCCEIKDYGDGIPEDEIEHIFDKFYRSEEQRHISGTGLGLAIAKQYAELLDSKITISNHAEGGINARLYIPIL